MSIQQKNLLRSSATFSKPDELSAPSGAIAQDSKTIAKGQGPASALGSTTPGFPELNFLGSELGPALAPKSTSAPKTIPAIIYTEADL